MRLIFGACGIAALAIERGVVAFKSAYGVNAHASEARLRHARTHTHTRAWSDLGTNYATTKIRISIFKIRLRCSTDPDATVRAMFGYRNGRSV